MRVFLSLIMVSILCAGAVLADEAKVYQLGPQDEIAVTVLRHDDLSKAYTVPPDGTIDFPRAGRIAVTGKTTAEVAEALRAKYAEFLLNPDVAVVLTKPRVKTASVMGAVGKPGAYPVTDTMRITDLIALAGDVVGERQELSANLTRDKATQPVDLQALFSGNAPEKNLRIQEGDLLSIDAPLRLAIVVRGQVKNPGAVKVRLGSTPADALAAAGDITDRPERVRITLVRGTTTQKIAWGDNTTKLQDGDEIQVELEKQARIFVSGQVKSTGMYDLPDGGGVLQAIAMAGGVLPGAALTQIAVVRAKDGTKERVDLSQVYKIDKITDAPPLLNPKLDANDQVIVPEWTGRIAVFGMVAKAGNFDVSEDAPLTVVDAISMAGVDNKKAKLSEVVVIRVVDNKPQRINVNVTDILKKGKNDLNIPLRSGDIVWVPENGKKDAGDIVDILYKLGMVAVAF